MLFKRQYSMVTIAASFALIIPSFPAKSSDVMFIDICGQSRQITIEIPYNESLPDDEPTDCCPKVCHAVTDRKPTASKAVSKKRSFCC